MISLNKSATNTNTLVSNVLQTGDWDRGQTIIKQITIVKFLKRLVYLPECLHDLYRAMMNVFDEADVYVVEKERQTFEMWSLKTELE